MQMSSANRRLQGIYVAHLILVCSKSLSHKLSIRGTLREQIGPGLILDLTQFKGNRRSRVSLPMTPSRSQVAKILNAVRSLTILLSPIRTGGASKMRSSSAPRRTTAGTFMATFHDRNEVCPRKAEVCRELQVAVKPAFRTLNFNFDEA
jgi:hypothetical protein